MVIKVGINGFGRIGRIMFRTCFQNFDIEVSAINDPAIDVEYICYLIKFDSIHGNFNGDVTTLDGDIKINGNIIKVFRAKQPSTVPWDVAGVQYVIESSGMFTSYEKAAGHLSVEGVRRVLITAPCSDVPMIILGVNDDKMQLDQKVISCASSTLYCLAPIMKVLESNFGVSEGFVTSIHAMTPSLKPLDGLCLRGKHWRDYRSIHQNIIPAMTGACKALGKILPQLKDKMVGLAFRVPIVNVSVLDLSVRLNRETTFPNIVKCVENAKETYLKGVLDISNEEAVSSDFIKATHSCILDINSSMQLRPNFYKFICWYENEFSYACRVVDLIILAEKQFSEAQIVEGRKLDSELLDNQVTCSFGKTLGSGYSSKPLSNVLRKFSKSFEFKNRSRKIEKTPQMKINQETETNLDLKNKSAEAKFSCIECNSSDKPAMNTPEPINVNTESLESVKREFNKMLNITEDLLDKSNKICTSESSENGVPQMKLFKELVRSNSNVLTSSTADTENSTDYQTNNSCECTDCSMDRGRKKSNNVTKKSSSELSFEGKRNYGKIAFEGGEIKEESDEEDNFQVKTLYDSDTEDSVNFKTCDLEPNTDLESLQEESNISTETSQINSVYKIKDCVLKKGHKHEEIYSQQSDISKLGKINISKDDIRTINSTRNKNENKTANYVIVGKSADYYKGKIMGRVMDKKNTSVQKQVISENLALHLEQENIRVSTREGTKTNDDIYDKLDSTSASNSENSFHVNEKQSQVIYINDLTNSLEDLGRLEKICKIIEISDDLSDELFSKLKAKDPAALKNKKWSFKDLCEKIKLDDFCDRVFHE
ncbi:uncharacterized protein [Battus philenor]|uniref:uncharacterized protein n=1 Tax=Battus philenor TaxID=42288 RepID=UPI0035CEC841